MATRDKVFQMVTALSILPNCPLTKENSTAINNMFFAVLGDIPDDYLQAAYIQYLSTDRPFFPSNPGVLRDIAFELELIANNIPTAGEAWAAVVEGPKHHEGIWCVEGGRLRDEYIQSQTHGLLADNRNHLAECTICKPGGWDEEYKHLSITEAVRRMGGRDAIFSDNFSADRARFMETFNELVRRERAKINMTPDVKAFITGDNKPELVSGTMGLLASKITK